LKAGIPEIPDHFLLIKPGGVAAWQHPPILAYGKVQKTGSQNVFAVSVNSRICTADKGSEDQGKPAMFPA
jgi:hypothetical protein